MIRNIAIVFAVLFLMGCAEQTFVPKPVAYPRIYLPELVNYQVFDQNCPYKFEYPNYVEIQKDSFFFEEQVVSDCWINMVYPSLMAKVHFSYKEIGKDISLEKVMEDSYELAYTHSKKADFIDEYEISNNYGVEGLMTDIGGDAANNIQFYLTDYKTHYLRGAVYFNSHPNNDSIQPALEFVREDMLHIFETFSWQ
jgi:gliding motility-associated lipoprotein GldD